MQLAIENVSKEYRKGSGVVKALDGVSLSMQSSDFVVVKGASGCGKTTLLLTLGAMLQPTSGKVQLADKDLYSESGARRVALRREDIGFVFQMFHLVPYLTVLENVALADNSGGAKAKDWLERLGMEHRAHHRPAELSAGERQRAAVARALVNNPKLVLADEPTGNLDPENAKAVMVYLRDYAKENGGMVMVVTHGNDADAMADSILSMDAGTFVGE